MRARDWAIGLAAMLVVVAFAMAFLPPLGGV